MAHIRSDYAARELWTAIPCGLAGISPRSSNFRVPDNPLGIIRLALADSGHASAFFGAAFFFVNFFLAVTLFLVSFFLTAFFIGATFLPVVLCDFVWFFFVFFLVAIRAAGLPRNLRCELKRV